MAEPATTGGGAPHCAVHPEVLAQLEPCERCGAYACDECFGLEGDVVITADRLCKSCRDLTGHGTVPWENATLPFGARLTQTLQLTLRDPGRAFESIGDGPVYFAGTFAVTTTLLGYGPILVLMLLGVGLFAVLGSSFLHVDDGGGSAVMAILCLFPFVFPPMILAVSFVVDLVFAIVFHVTAMMLGGKASFSASLRGTLYASAVRVLLAPISILGFVPLIGPLFSLAARIGMLVWVSLALAGTARRVHRLPPTPAMIAGAMPAIVLVLLTIAMAVGLVVLAMSGVLPDDDFR